MTSGDSAQMSWKNIDSGDQHDNRLYNCIWNMPFGIDVWHSDYTIYHEKIGTIHGRDTKDKKSDGAS